jgi:hypothetical protein
MQEQWESGYFVAGSGNGAIVVFGFGSRRQKREDEITAAKNDAARKVAFFHGVKGTVESSQTTGGNFFSNDFDSQINLENMVEYEQFIEQLQYDPGSDVLLYERGTIVRFKYAANTPSVNSPGTAAGSFSGARPGWTNGSNLPVVAGYITAVGISRNQRLVGDTVMKSTVATVAAIIERVSVSVQSSDLDVSGQGAVSQINTKSEAVLDGFMVLEFWINPDNGFVYSLGIARIPE